MREGRFSTKAGHDPGERSEEGEVHRDSALVLGCFVARIANQSARVVTIDSLPPLRRGSLCAFRSLSHCEASAGPNRCRVRFQARNVRHLGSMGLWAIHLRGCSWCHQLHPTLRPLFFAPVRHPCQLLVRAAERAYRSVNIDAVGRTCVTSHMMRLMLCPMCVVLLGGASEGSPPGDPMRSRVRPR